MSSKATTSRLRRKIQLHLLLVRATSEAATRKCGYWDGAYVPLESGNRDVFAFSEKDDGRGTSFDCFEHEPETAERHQRIRRHLARVYEGAGQPCCSSSELQSFTMTLLRDTYSHESFRFANKKRMNPKADLRRSRHFLGVSYLEHLCPLYHLISPDRR